MSATDLQRYKTMPRKKLIEMIQQKTRGTTAHFTVIELGKMAVEDLAALLVHIENKA